MHTTFKSMLKILPHGTGHHIKQYISQFNEITKKKQDISNKLISFIPKT